MQSKVFSTNKTLNLRGRIMDLTIPKVMGILNVTPDSFYDGGKFTQDKSILEQAGKLFEEGADWVDVGGYSTRPGAVEISEAEELKRVTHAITLIRNEFPQGAISVDTFRASVAKAAAEAGACLINDISGGERDEKMFELVAQLQLPYVLMHLRGTPQTMNQLTTYDHLIKDITDYLQRKIYRLQALGVKDIIVDPGFGFAKTVGQNFELLNQLDLFGVLGKPLLAGLSRKSMIWRTLETTPEHALAGTISLNTVALLKGASILRVHDVREAVQCIRLIRHL